MKAIALSTAPLHKLVSVEFNPSSLQVFTHASIKCVSITWKLLILIDYFAIYVRVLMCMWLPCSVECDVIPGTLSKNLVMLINEKTGSVANIYTYMCK